MVAATPRYRTQSDPDGVIHVSDDDVDFNDSEYGYVKSAGQAANVVDVTHIVDPPDVQEMQHQVDRRDPPTDPGSPIFDHNSMGSKGQLVEEGTPRTAAGLSSRLSPTTGKDPSLRSNPSPSLTRSNAPMAKPPSSQSVVKSSSPLVKSNFIARDEPLPSPVRSTWFQAQEGANGESVGADRGGATSPMGRASSPIAPSESPSGADTKRANWPSPQLPGQTDAIVGTSQPKTVSKGTKAEPDLGPVADLLDKPLITSQPTPRPKLPDAPANTPGMDQVVPRQASSLTLTAETAGVMDVPADAVGAANETEKEEDSDAMEHATTSSSLNPKQVQECDVDDNRWIFSGILNTLICRGPEPVGGSTSGPLGLVTCGATKEKQEDAFAHDDEENSVLGPKGFGDLASLPSLEDSIIHKAGDNDTDNESLSSRVSRSSMQTECLGNAVESKIKNLEIEQQLEADTKKDQADSAGDVAANDPDVQRLTQELNAAMKSFGQHHVRCAQVSSALVEKYTEKKAYKRALALQRKTVSVFSTKLGDHHQETLDAKLRLGKCLEDAEEYDEGISSFYEVMAMRRSLEGDKDPSTSDALILIANCLRKKGQYMQAIRELKRALKVYRESLGDSHPSVASTVDEIASLYVTLGDFEKSAAILEEVVKLKAATLGMQNKQVATSLVELATSYECSEDFDRAVKALKKAYKIYTDLEGFSCEEATSTLHRIALIYQASGDIHKAAIAYLGVLRGKKHLLGDDHLEVAETYYRLGVCLRETNQLDKALKCMKEALPILVGKGKNIHDVDMIAEVMHEMALLYKAKRQLTEAAKIFKQELTVRRKIGQPDYPCIAKTLNHLGVTEYEMKMHRRALKHLLEVLTIFQERQEQGIDFAEALYNIGLVFEAVRNKERAYEAFLEAARVFKANGYSNDHPHMTKAVNKVKRLGRR